MNKKNSVIGFFDKLFVWANDTFALLLVIL